MTRPTAADILREARVLVERSDNDYTWSSWPDRQHALAEIDDLIDRVEAGTAGPGQAAVLFAPTGPLQELAESSGWGGSFLELAERLDGASGEDPDASATYPCAICGRRAGSIALFGPTTSAELRRESFTGSLRSPVSHGAFTNVREALADGGAGVVFGLDQEYAPFYCPVCSRSFCGDHWERRNVFDEDMPNWRDSIRGRCPHGHERMLED
jgi:hypothetical protein